MFKALPLTLTRGDLLRKDQQGPLVYDQDNRRGIFMTNAWLKEQSLKSLRASLAPDVIFYKTD